MSKIAKYYWAIARQWLVITQNFIHCCFDVSLKIRKQNESNQRNAVISKHFSRRAKENLYIRIASKKITFVNSSEHEHNKTSCSVNRCSCTGM